METIEMKTNQTTTTMTSQTTTKTMEMKSEETKAFLERYRALNLNLNYGMIKDVLDTFRTFREKIEEEYVRLQQLKTLIIANEGIEHKCFFKEQQVTREIFFLSNTLPKLIPGLEIDFMATRLKLYYKNREFFMEFASYFYNGKVSVHFTLFSYDMHTSLNCNSFGDLESVDFTNFTHHEFVDKVTELLNKTFVKNCYYCGTVTY
jgi:hypothetical protein